MFLGGCPLLSASSRAGQLLRAFDSSQAGIGGCPLGSGSADLPGEAESVHFIRQLRATERDVRGDS